MFLSWKSPGPPVHTPTLDGAIAFWAGKDPDETYDWSRSEICACGQYAKSIGDNTWLNRDRRYQKFWEALNTEAHASPRTFGALTQRAKATKAYIFT